MGVFTFLRDTVVGDYEYDGRGQRVSKTAAAETVHYVYGPSGELLGEYPNGATDGFTEYVYLQGQPIAMVSRSYELYIPPGAELIMDNGDPGTSSTGSWQTKTDSQDYGVNYEFANKSSNRTYRWTATPPGIIYDVYAWWVDHQNQSANVTYTIRYGTGETDTVLKSHKTGGGQWQLLGSYHSTDGQDYVEVSSGSNKFVADAIRWVEQVDPIIILNESTNFIHTDHLGTPRRVTDDSQTIIWRWDSTPFGELAPDEDPDGDLESQTLNLRFPGQYYDVESGLYYNYFRTYDPETGRYNESDPIGLGGGLNTFGYGLQNPVRNIDPTGQSVGLCFAGALVEPTPLGEIACGCYAAYRGFRLINNLLSISNDLPNCGGGGGSDGGDSECGDEDNCDTPLNQLEIEKLKNHLGGREALHKEKSGFGGSSALFDFYKCRNGDIVVKRKGGGPILEHTGLNINNL